MKPEVKRPTFSKRVLARYQPAGRVRISALLRMNIDTIRVFAITKLGWIKSQQKKLREQDRETPREYLDRQSRYVWGKRYLLKVEERDDAPEVELKHGRMIFRIRPGTCLERKQEILAAWYREKLKDVVPVLIAKWEQLMNKKVERFYVQKMKTKSGSCSHQRKSIRLNADLARKPPECLECIVVHEMVHF